MKRLKTFLIIFLCTIGFGSMVASAAEQSPFGEELAAIRHEFDAASFSGLKKSERKAAFEALVEHADDFSARYSDQVEAVGWNGIVLSAYAGEVGAFGAMKVAKSALEALEQAEAIQANALDGGVYASLGALYSKVPGGFVGFGDDEVARAYFEKALDVDADNIDSNFFYGEFLIDQGEYEQAVAVLQRALAAPKVDDRPLFDSGRRAAIREMLDEAKDHIPQTAAR